MIINYFDIGENFSLTAKTYPVLIIDAYAILTFSVTAQRLKMITGRNSQI